MATLPPIGSPSPTSASASPTATSSKKEARKMFKAETDRIVEAIKSIPTLAYAVAEAGKGKVAVQMADGTVAEIGRAEVREFVGQTASAVKQLPNLAGRVFKSHRKSSPDAGFMAPARVVSEIVAFFSNADIGPTVTGQFTVDKDGKPVPDNRTLQMVQGTRLNDNLFFLQDPQNNPLYGIIRAGVLTPLFALHAYYGGMIIPNETGRLRASQAMRQYLAPVMRNTIDKDVDKYSRQFPGQAAAIQALGERLKQAINDPNMRIDSKVAGVELFNPNYFPYAHFQKINSNAKATGSAALTEAGLSALGPQAAQYYGQRIPGIDATNAVGAVLDAQKRSVALGTAHKNVIQDREKRARKAAAKAAGV